MAVIIIVIIIVLMGGCWLLVGVMTDILSGYPGKTLTRTAAKICFEVERPELRIISRFNSYLGTLRLSKFVKSRFGK